METEGLNEALKFFVALLAIVNPVGTVPIFINLTANQDPASRKRNSFTAALAMAIILVVVLFSGDAVLHFFGISVGSFRVGGGILILLMAISMLHAKLSNVRQTREEELDTADRDSIAVVPMATPLLAGPGAISTVILYAQHNPGPARSVLLFSVVLLVALVTGLLLRMAPVIDRILGKTGINIVTRLMGLIMAAMGVEFIAQGIKQLFPLTAG